MTSCTLKPWIVLGSLTGFVLGGCSTGRPTTITEQMVAERQRLMKLQGASMQVLKVKVRAGNLDAVAVWAENLAISSRQIPQLFPEGSLSEKSRAKPAIWEKWSEFESYASSLRAQAMKVGEFARKKDKAGTEAAVEEMGRTACAACHDAFRDPPHRSGSLLRGP